VLTPTNGPLNPRRGNFSSDLTSVRYEGAMVKYAGTSLGRWQVTVPMPGSWSAYSRVMGVGEWTEDGQPDLPTVDDSGVMRLHRASGYYAYAAGTVVGTGWGTMRQVFAAGDFSGDNHADLMAVSADGGLYLYKGNGKGGWLGSRVRIGSGWQGFRTVLSPGDFTGDDNADVIAVKPSGKMYLYRGSGRGGFTGGGTRIGTGWGIFL
jgi:VCBS repeat protein